MALRPSQFRPCTPGRPARLSDELDAHALLTIVPDDLRVVRFPSKHSRVRIPSPALRAECHAARPLTRRPTSKADPSFGGSEQTPWPVRLTPSLIAYYVFMRSHETKRCRSAKPGDRAKDSGGDRAPASLGQAREAHLGFRPQWIAPRLPASRVGRESPKRPRTGGFD